MVDISNGTFWSETNDSNNSAPPSGAPEGMSPALVNDTIRYIMGGIKRSWDRINSTVTSTGSGSAYAITYPVNPVSYSPGERFCWFANVANTGAASLNIGGLGAVSIIHPDGSALAAGDIVGGPQETIYNGSSFVLTSGGNLNKYLPLTGGNVASLTIGGATPYTTANLNPSLYAPLSGATFTGDIITSRAGTGSPTTGVIFLGNTGSRYLYFDGTNYVLNGANLLVNGASLWTTSNFAPSSYFPVSGGTISGSLGVTGNITLNGTLTTGGTGTFPSLTVFTGGASNAVANLVNSSRSVALLLDTIANFGLYDNSAGFWRFITDASGNCTAHGVSYATDFAQTSDATLKRNVIELGSARETIMGLRPVQFDWIDGPKTTSVGFIAQDVQQVLPLAVQPSLVTDKLTVSPMPIIATLVKHVQELEQRLALLENAA